jgi:hypothetical protein
MNLNVSNNIQGTMTKVDLMGNRAHAESDAARLNLEGRIAVKEKEDVIKSEQVEHPQEAEHARVSKDAKDGRERPFLRAMKKKAAPQEEPQPEQTPPPAPPGHLDLRA